MSASETPAVGDVGHTKVLLSDDGRGNSTVALRAFKKGEVIFQEPPLALVYPVDDPPWLKTLRESLEKQNKVCAWQYCVALHCLVEDELPNPWPEGLPPLGVEARSRLEELCGCPDMAEFEPSHLAIETAELLLAARSNPINLEQSSFRALALHLDSLAARVSRNGFQIMDLKRRPPTSADGLFHRISFFNHCCIGMNNASWVWDGSQHLLSVKAACDIAAGEELTISYIAKPWSDLAKSARQLYLKQNFNFECLCRACSLSEEDEQELRKALGLHNEQTKSNSKLGTLLMNWLENGQSGGADESAHVATDEPQNDQNAHKDDKPSKPSGPITDEERLSRVLARCAKECIEVSSIEAQAALLAEDGHVGKTIIRLRRARREAVGALANVPGKDRDGHGVGRSSRLQPAMPQTWLSLRCASMALFTMASVGLVVSFRARHRVRI